MNIARTIVGYRLAMGFFGCCLLSGNVSAQSHKAEIFIGADKGIGQNEMTFPVAEGDNELIIPTGNLQSGAYLLSVRIQDDQGRWTPTVSRMIYVYNRESLQGAEYFVDEDPGVGNGVSVPGIKEGIYEFNVPTGSLEVGPHTLTLRTLGHNGALGVGMSRSFLVNSERGNGVEIEWFFDSDPGVGKGNIIPAESGENIIMLPTNDLTPGVHLLSIRVRDSKEHTTTTVTHSLYVAEPADDLVGGEYFVDEDPGEGAATWFGLDENGMNSFVIPTKELEVGTHYLTLRGKTETGKWIPLHIAPFEVTSENGVEKIEWKMTFDITRGDSEIILTGNDIISGSRVDVITLSGIRIHSGKWEDGSMPYVINADKSERNLILTVVSPDGVKTVKRLR